MRSARMRTDGWSHRLYVSPDSFREYMALRLKGFRRWDNPVFGDFIMVHERHRMQTCPAKS